MCICSIDHKMKKGWKQGQKLLKKESNVGMLLTGKQAQKQAACRDDAHWFTKH